MANNISLGTELPAANDLPFNTSWEFIGEYNRSGGTYNGTVNFPNNITYPILLLTGELSGIGTVKTNFLSSTKGKVRYVFILDSYTSNTGYYGEQKLYYDGTKYYFNIQTTGQFTVSFQLHGSLNELTI